MIYHATNLKPVCFISAGSWNTTAHFVVDAPSTSIVCLETLTAAVGRNVPQSRFTKIQIELSRPAYFVADSHLVTVSAPTLVAKGIPTSELTKLKSVTAANDVRNVTFASTVQQYSWKVLWYVNNLICCEKHAQLHC